LRRALAIALLIPLSGCQLDPLSAFAKRILAPAEKLLQIKRQEPKPEEQFSAEEKRYYNDALARQRQQIEDWARENSQ
jgi:hypothetical protein